MSERIFTPDPDVVDTPLDGDETVLLHLNTKRYFTLNATGSVIWRALKQGATVKEIGLQLERRCDVSAERATLSVATLIEALLEQRLVRAAEEP